MTQAATAAIYFNVHLLRGLRAIAATVLCRFAQDIAAGWTPDREDWKQIHAIRARFRLPLSLMEGMICAYKQDAQQPH
jgi:hypothetical protein